MKKFFNSEWVTFLVCSCLLAALLFGVFTVCGWMDYNKTTESDSVYPLTVQVVELDRENDIVTCTDGAGNDWEFYGVEDWQIGDFASLLMDNNGTTETIYDDIILMAHYAGIFEN